MILYQNNCCLLGSVLLCNVTKSLQEAVLILMGAVNNSVSFVMNNMVFNGTVNISIIHGMC